MELSVKLFKGKVVIYIETENQKINTILINYCIKLMIRPSLCVL